MGNPRGVRRDFDALEKRRMAAVRLLATDRITARSADDSRSATKPSAAGGHFTCDSGLNIPALPASNFPGGLILGTTVLATNNFRHADPAYHTIGPRLGLAYRLDNKTVVRGGAGFYYGMNFATNWKYGGAAWNYDLRYIPTLDNYVTQYATFRTRFRLAFRHCSREIWRVD